MEDGNECLAEMMKDRRERFAVKKDDGNGAFCYA